MCTFCHEYSLHTQVSLSTLSTLCTLSTLLLFSLFSIRFRAPLVQERQQQAAARRLEERWNRKAQLCRQHCRLTLVLSTRAGVLALICQWPECAPKVKVSKIILCTLKTYSLTADVGPGIVGMMNCCAAGLGLSAMASHMHPRGVGHVLPWESNPIFHPPTGRQ